MYGYVFHDLNGPNHRSNIEDPVLLSNDICTDTRSQASCGKDNLRRWRRFHCDWDGKKYRVGNVFLFTERKDCSCLCMWTTKKLAEKKQNIDPMWKVLSKEIDLGEPTSFLDHVYLGCTQRECETSKDIVDNYRHTFGSGRRNLAQTSLHGPMIWKVMQRNVWSDIASWRTEQLNSFSKSQHHALTTFNLKKKNGICWRIVKSVFSNCREMQVFGTNWWT